MLALAEQHEILVPTCRGGYIAARIAFRKQEALEGSR